MLIRVNFKRTILIGISLLLQFTLFTQSGYKLDTMRFSKMIKLDTAYLNESLDDSLLYIHSMGLVESKSDHVLNILNGKIIYQTMNVLESKYTNKDDYIIGIGTIRVKGRFEQIPFDVSLRYSDIYQRKNRKYKLIYWQSTKLK